jgi:hypothetical protein
VRIHPSGTIATVLITATVLTACGGAATTTASAPPATTAAATASGAAGCAQATVAVAAARQDISAQDYAGAVTVISGLRDSAHGKVAIDAAFAATDLALLRADVAQGSPVYADLKDSLAALDKISADCPAA